MRINEDSPKPTAGRQVRQAGSAAFALDVPCGHIEATARYTAENPPYGGFSVAERVGFEPTVRLHVHTLSRRASSATPAPLRVFTIFIPSGSSRRSSPQANEAGHLSRCSLFSCLRACPGSLPRRSTPQADEGGKFREAERSRTHPTKTINLHNSGHFNKDPWFVQR